MRTFRGILVFALLILTAGSCSRNRSFSTAEQALKNKNWDLAVHEYEQALQQDPNNVEIKLKFNMAKVFASRLHYEEAKRLLEANQLAEALGVELLRFDMSEYMERHTVSRLIGAPPGYVGFDQGGLLTEEIVKHPHSVLLLDEIEKAHPDVFNLLLQVMDHGTLTDNNGRKADFRNVILVMTTNAGAERLSRSSMGFTKQDHAGDELQEIKRLFSPEFRNRMDAVIQFKSLDETTIAHVVDKFILEFEAQLADKHVTIELDDAARAWLAKRGYDPTMGARPMARLIQEQVKKPLANELLFGSLASGGHVKVTARDEGLAFDFVPAVDKTPA